MMKSPDVELRLPADGAYVAILRTATAGLAARIDFTLDDIEDLRIAVGEACAMVLPEAELGSDLVCSYFLSPGRLTVEVAVTATRDSGTSTVRVEVSSTDRDIAVAVANGLAAEAEQLGEGDATAEVVVVVEAGTAGVTSDPPRNLYIAALVALAGLLLAGGLYQIRERTS